MINNVMRAGISGCDAGSNASSKDGIVRAVSKSPRSKTTAVKSRKRVITPDGDIIAKVSDGVKIKTSITPTDGAGQKDGPAKKPKTDGLIASPPPQQNLLFEVGF